ncbi:MAG: MFS transporter [Puniceicoccales bacterium]|jgi:MFS family permease|nr:MFS transporter [Puniceicoccales bacterium]
MSFLFNQSSGCVPRASPVEKKTFRLDCFRFTFQGCIDVVFKNYVLLIAIRVFRAPETVKGILSAASYLGMALTPFALHFFTKIYPLPNNRVIGLLLFIVAGAVILGLFSTHWFMFSLAIILAKILYKQTFPFVTDIYNRNYPKERRGRILGILFTILGIAGVFFAYFCGRLLDHSLSNYHWILLATALAALCSGYIFLRIPNGHMMTYNRDSFLRSNLSILFNDRLFTFVLCLWSLTSIAFQMTAPLRMEYLANQRYGFNLSNGDITLITVTIPMITRIGSAFFWGKFFDTQNLALMKITINGCYLLSIPLFFFTDHFLLWIFSAIVLGLGYSGNLTAWQLWVTKIVPSPEKLGIYMSLDVAIMGLRDALSAALGYFLLSRSISLQTVCIMAMLLIVASLIGFCFLLKNPRLR